MKTAFSVPPVEISDELLSDFQFRFRNWDSMSVDHPPFLTEPFCITRHEHEFLRQSVERIHPLMVNARRAISGSPDQMRCLGLDPWTQEAIAHELKSMDGSGIEIARYDFFKTTDGRWMISEINNDVPSGFNESSFMCELANKFWSDTDRYEIPAPITDNFVSELKRNNLKSLAMLYGTAYSEDLQICLFLKDRLENSHLKITLASPSHVKVFGRKTTVWGQEIDSIYRIYPVEWFSALPNRDTWMKILSLPKLRLINPLSTIISQSKNFFSILNAYGSDLFGADSSWIQQFIPHTKPFESGTISAYIEEKDRWVLKPIFGRMGYDVAVGKLLTTEKWQDALNVASKKSEQYCIQECFDIAPVHFSIGACYPCVGVFVINGRFSGYFTRASLTPLTTYEAMDVATVIGLS